MKLYRTKKFLSVGVVGMILYTVMSATTTYANSPSDSVTGDGRKDTYVNGIVYQLSAEVVGLQKQSFVLAKLQLDNALKHPERHDKPLAIVTDVDQTIMSDTTYQATMMNKPGTWDNGPRKGYYHAVASTADQPIPGAVEFFNYAKSKGVTSFYITNRAYDTKELAVAQLQHFGFPDADDLHVMPMNEAREFNKDARRAEVAKNYDVILYLGDNISDFTSAFKKELGPINRTQLALSDTYEKKWGTEWIVLPNATYGDYIPTVWYNKPEANRNEATRELFHYWDYTNPQWNTWYDGFVKD